MNWHDGHDVLLQLLPQQRTLTPLARRVVRTRGPRAMKRLAEVYVQRHDAEDKAGPGHQWPSGLERPEKDLEENS